MNGMQQHVDAAPAVAAAAIPSAVAVAPATTAAVAAAEEPTGNASTATIALLPPATRKDRSLREFLDMMEEYAPIVRFPFPPPSSVPAHTYSRSPTQ